MAYATKADIEAAYGPDLLPRICDYDGDTLPDDSVVTQNLAVADGVINSYLAVRYTIPLATPLPAILVKWAVDLTVYFIANTADRLTQEMRIRYEDAIQHLKDIAAGKATLGYVDPDPTDGTDTPDAAAAGRAYSFRSTRC